MCAHTIDAFGVLPTALTRACVDPNGERLTLSDEARNERLINH